MCGRQFNKRLFLIASLIMSVGVEERPSNPEDTLVLDKRVYLFRN